MYFEPLETNQNLRWLQIVLLILAGEAIFLLPFVLVRIFRPTFLRVLEIDNTELGLSFSVYGILALISYSLGGIIADKVAPKFLIASALIATALGGFYLLKLPSADELIWLYAYWGVTTILLFWAPLFKATRSWGSKNKQAFAFGLLEGGRGTVAALLGVFGLSIFAMETSSFESISDLERVTTFRTIVAWVSSFVALVGVVILVFLKSQKSSEKLPIIKLSESLKILKHSKTWFIMCIILSAYVGYKITDFFPQYATDVLNTSEEEAGRYGTILMITRPVTAVVFAFIGDRFVKSTLIQAGFVLMGVCAAVFASGWITASFSLIFLLNMLITGVAVYALRALYFALMEEGNFSYAKTGSVVGFVSMIGFTPDIFVGPISGYYLDMYPGMQGFQFIFFGLLICAAVGFLASYLFGRSTKRGNEVI